MKNILFSVVFIFINIGLISCYAGRPISTVRPANNKTYEVDYLFEKVGCKVYRFYDMGHYVYFTNCYNEITSVSNDSLQTKISTISINKK